MSDESLVIQCPVCDGRKSHAHCVGDLLATPDAGARETEIARVISSEIGDAIAAHEAGEGEAAVSKRGETVARWIMDRIHPTPPRAASPEPGAFTPQMAYEVWRDSERDEAEGETRWHMLAAEINLRLQNMNPPAPSGATDREPIDALRDALYHAHVAGQRVHDLRVDTVTALAYASGAVEYMNLGSELPAHPPAAASPEPGAYAITLQRMIEAHCRGERVNETLSPHIGAMLNANLAAPRADATAGGVDINTPMPEHFREYVERNYPPGVVIGNPAWHAPKLWGAALYALRAAQPETSGGEG